MGALVVFLEHLGHLDGRRSNSFRGQQLARGKHSWSQTKDSQEQKTGGIVQDSHHPFFGMLDLVRIWKKCGWAISYDKIYYYTILYYTILYYTILYCTILYYTTLYYTVLYCTILHYTVLYYTILCCTVLYCTILYCTVLYYSVLYRTILLCTVLYYTILYDTYNCYIPGWFSPL